MATRFFGKGLLKLIDGTLPVGSTTFKIMLLDDAYTFDPDHEFVTSVASNELSDPSGYAGGFNGAGRKTITFTFDYDATTNAVRVEFPDKTWTSFDDGSSTELCGAAVIIAEVTNDAASHLIAHIDYAADKATNVDTFVVDMIAIASGGQLQLAV